MTKDNQRRIVFLDYMRIFAFASVLIGHKFYPAMDRFVADQNNSGIARWALELVMPMFYGGVVGVIVFFLVSGYVITHVLRQENTYEFLLRRAFRIYPLYIFAVVTQTILDSTIHDMPVPGLETLIPRALLIGDFFGTPYSLNGVEWTLRIEVIFYIYMAILKKLGLMEKPTLLPLIYAATVALIFFSPAFPKAEALAFGYTSIYFGILLVGSCIYLVKHKTSPSTTALFSAATITAASIIMINKYQPAWSGMYFIYCGISIFCLSLIFEKHFIDGKLIKLLSSLTFSIYLFHNWLTDYIVEAIKYTQTVVPGNSLIAMPILFGLCYIAHLAIERPAIQAGRAAALTPPLHKSQL